MTGTPPILPPCPSPRRLASGGPKVPAFTLVELMVVIAIMVLLMGLVPLALSGRKQAGDLTKAAFAVAGALEMARTHATANNTHVWVGFFEEAIDNTAPGTPGTGRLVIATVASRDGTALYDREAAATGNATQALPGARLAPVGNLQKIDNIHLLANPAASFPPSVPADRFDTRPGALAGFSATDRLAGGGSYTPRFSFQWPVGGTPVYRFAEAATLRCSGIVQFNPRGEAITDSGPVPGVVPGKEIVLQPTHGAVPDRGHNVAAVHIAGMTGVVTIYRR